MSECRRAGVAPVFSSTSVIAGVAIIIVLSVVAYYPSLRGGFILDDDLLLTGSNLIKAKDGLYRFWCTTEAPDYWPVPSTTLWLEWRLWGMDPTGYHVTNLLLHLAEVLLLWRILSRLAVPGAFLAALLFAVHPVNVESVAWVAQRKGLMAMLFFLLSILFYVRAEEAPPSSSGASHWYGLSLAMFVLAMLSKVSAVVLPAVVLGIVRWKRPLVRRDLLRIAPFSIVLVALLSVNLWFRTHGAGTPIETATPLDRVLGAGNVIWFYLYKALVPLNLIFIYPEWHVRADQLSWWPALPATIVTTGVLWWYRKGWSRPLLFAWMYFCVALVPVLGLTDVGFLRHIVVADHYQHVALIGVTTLIAAGWGTWRQRLSSSAVWLANAVAIVVVGGLTALTWKQSSLYANATTLYEDTVARNPGAWMAHNNLGVKLIEARKFPEAIKHFEQAVASFPDAENNWGLALLHEDRPEEASEHIQRALQSNPKFPEAHYNMGNVLARTGHSQQAIASYEEALRLKPDYPEAHHDLAAALAAADEPEKAIEHYRQALSMKPDDPQYHYDLGTALARSHQIGEAIVHFEEAVRLKPDYAEAHNNLGGALSEAGKLEEAYDRYQQAVRLKPDFPEAHYNLGRALLQREQRQEAVAQFKEALRLKADYLDAHNDLGVALVQTGQLREAIEHFRQALKIKPDDRAARENLDETLGMEGQGGAAEAEPRRP